jgi:hypothetical protein
MATTEAGHSFLVPGTSVIATALNGSAAVTSAATPVAVGPLISTGAPVVSTVATVSTVASTPMPNPGAGGAALAGSSLHS